MAVGILRCEWAIKQKRGKKNCGFVFLIFKFFFNQYKISKICVLSIFF